MVADISEMTLRETSRGGSARPTSPLTRDDSQSQVTASQAATSEFSPLTDDDFERPKATRSYCILQAHYRWALRTIYFPPPSFGRGSRSHQISTIMICPIRTNEKNCGNIYHTKACAMAELWTIVATQVEQSLRSHGDGYTTAKYTN